MYFLLALHHLTLTHSLVIRVAGDANSDRIPSHAVANPDRALQGSAQNIVHQGVSSEFCIDV
jgi:hypothetical protein